MPRRRRPRPRQRRAPLRRKAAAHRTSCGVVVTDGAHLLVGHNPRSPLWDIPKGVADPGEPFADAALRELREETGLHAPPAELIPLGVQAYLRGKDLALFTWPRAAMPDPATLTCTSFFRLPDGTRIPEFDRFAVLPWPDAVARVGKNLARLLTEFRASPAWPSPLR